MKKLIGFSALIVTCAVNADIIGAKAGAEYWHISDQGPAYSVYAQIEHPIPMLPNFALRGTGIEVENLSKDDNLQVVDGYGYYEIFDNDVVSFDIGVGINFLNGAQVYKSDFLPIVTFDAEWLPGSMVSGYTKINYGKLAKSGSTDASLGIRFSPLPAISLQAGYRYYDLQNNDPIKDRTLDGFTVGIHVDI